MRVWDEHWQRVLILFEVLEDLAPAGFLHRDYYHISDRRWHQIRQHRRLYIDRAWMGALDRRAGQSLWRRRLLLHIPVCDQIFLQRHPIRSEEHTSELQS